MKSIKNFSAHLLATFSLINSFNFAKASSITDIGVLGTGSDAYAIAASSKGSTIVGYSEISSGGVFRAFKYTAADGMSYLGDVLPGGSNSYATGISNNGSVIVGYSDVTGGNNHAFKYTSTDGMIDLQVLSGGLSGGSNSYAYGISGNGLLIFGEADISSGDFHAFKYTDTDGMIDLGVLSGGSNSVAYGASYDGSIIVGSSEVNASGDDHAFKYTVDHGMVDLGVLSGGTNSYAYNISFDGSTIVGYGDVSSGNEHAFKYQNGVMTDLGVLPGGSNSQATAASNNGLVVVGYGDVASGNTRAFKYINNKMYDLGVLTGGNNSYAYGVSADGSVIVGRGDDSSGDYHAFIYKNDILVNLDNTYKTLYQNGAQLNSVMNFKTAVLQSTLNQECNKFGKNNICTSVGYRYSHVSNRSSQQQASNLKFAYRFTPKIKVGAVIDQSFADNTPNNFVIRNYNPLLSIYTTFNQNNDGSGLRLKLAAAENNDNLSIRRNTLADTEAGIGSASIRSKGLFGEISYSKNINQDLLIRPFAGIRKMSVVRSSYTENQNISFPISYDAVKQNFTTSIFGIDSALKINDALSLSLAVGIENNFRRNINGYSGNVGTLDSFSLNSPHLRRKNNFINTGISYDLKENQQISTNVIYGNQSLNNSKSTVFYLNYYWGF